MHLQTYALRCCLVVILAASLFHGVPVAAQDSGYVGTVYVSTGTRIPARAADPESFFPAGTSVRVTNLPPSGTPALRRALVAWNLPALQFGSNVPFPGQQFCGGMFVRERAGASGTDRWEIVKQRSRGPVGNCNATWFAPVAAGSPFARLDLIIANEPSQSESALINVTSSTPTIVVPGGTTRAADGMEAVSDALSRSTPNPRSSFMVSLQRLSALTQCDVGLHSPCDFQWRVRVGNRREIAGVATPNTDHPIIRALLNEGTILRNQISVSVHDEEGITDPDPIGSCDINIHPGIFAAAELHQGALQGIYPCGNVAVTLQILHIATPTLSGTNGRDIDPESASRFTAYRRVRVGNDDLDLPGPTRLATRIVTTEQTSSTLQLILDAAVRGEGASSGWAGRIALSLRWEQNTWVFDNLQNLSLRRSSAADVEALIRSYSARPSSGVTPTPTPTPASASPTPPSPPPSISPVPATAPISPAEPSPNTASTPVSTPVATAPSPATAASESTPASPTTEGNAAVASPSPASALPVPQPAPPPIPVGISPTPFHVIPLALPSLIARIEFRDSGVSPLVNQALLDKFHAALATAAAGESVRKFEALVMQRALASSTRRGEAVETDLRQLNFLATGRVTAGTTGRANFAIALGQAQPPRNLELEAAVDALVAAIRLPRTRTPRRRSAATVFGTSVELEVRVIWQRAAPGNP
jgi:hypothetical protein